MYVSAIAHGSGPPAIDHSRKASVPASRSACGEWHNGNEVTPA
jgi:hypothetical protein